MTDKEALRYLYKQFRMILTSFPSSLDDIVGLPEGYDTVYELIEQADREVDND